MRIDGSSNLVYTRFAGVNGPAAAGPAQRPQAGAQTQTLRRAESAQRLDRLERSERTRLPSTIDRLVAGRVAGRVDFSGETAQPSASGDTAIPLYGRAADRNAVATTISLGKSLDIEA